MATHTVVFIRQLTPATTSIDSGHIYTVIIKCQIGYYECSIVAVEQYY